MKKVGVLYDNVSGNTGDVAIGLSIKQILRRSGVAFDELTPGNFNPLKYDTIVIGGGHILRPSPDFYYDKFKVPGAHVLNAAGIVGTPDDLQYLRDYEYVTVRSQGDKRKLAYLHRDVRVVPCTAMLLEDAKDCPLAPKKPCIGVHLNPGSLAEEDEGRFVRWAASLPYSVYFLPITHFCRDYAYMEKLASRIDGSVLLPLLKPPEISALIGRFDHFISASLHGAIFSYAHRVPFILCDSDEKMRFFMEDRGLGRHLFTGFEGMKKAFENVVEKPPDYSRKLSADLRALDAHVRRIEEILPTPGTGASGADPSDFRSQEAHQVQNLQLQAIYLGSHVEALTHQNKRLAAHAHRLEKRLERASPDGGRPGEVYACALRRMERWSDVIAHHLKRLYGKKASRGEENGLRPQDGEDYRKWIKMNEPSADALEAMKIDARCLSYRPKISVVLDADAPEGLLRGAIETVLGQAYDHWELCIAFDGSAGTRSLLEKYANADGRVKLKALSGAGDVPGRMNGAIALASGEFVCFMDGRDELAPFALYEIVRTLNRTPGLDYVYTDHDHVDGSGGRFRPFFKPGWSPDLLLSCWYTDRLEAYRRQALECTGFFRQGFEDCHGYDLTLRFTELLSPDKIGHVPHILYHKRTRAEVGNGQDSGGLRAVGEALARRGERGHVSAGKWPGSYRVKRAIIGSPMVSIIIPTKNNGELLERCIESIRQKTTYKNYEIVLIDHESTDIAPDRLSGPGLTRVPYAGKFNFSRMNNIAVDQARGDYLLFLNNDTEVIEPGWLQAMLEQAGRPGVGAVGCKLLYPDGSVQHAGLITGMGPDPVTSVAGHIFNRSLPSDPGYLGWIDVIRNYSGVTAAAMMIRRGIFMRSGGFDENLPVGYNDVDLCLRLRARGFVIVYTPYAALLHHESRTINAAPQVKDDARDVLYMLHKWGKALKNDPYYNPNLSLRSGRCELNVPPISAEGFYRAPAGPSRG